jgi:putative transposase
MAEENNSSVVEPEKPTAVVPVKEKQKRAPRKPKSVATKSVAEPVAPPNARTSTAPAKAKAPATKPAVVKAASIDGIADLLKLEDENKKLRKQLAEKLQAENVELRKRLGLK